MKTSRLLVCLLSLSAIALTARSDEAYLGLAGTLTLPQGGSRLHRIGGAAVRGGWYYSELHAVEGEVSWQEDFCGLAVQGLSHWSAWSLYDEFFGYSQFDPFVTYGAKGWLGRCGQVGPKVGVGAFYHLSDAWAVRADADAALGLETNCEMVYSVSVGLQYGF